MGSLWARCCRCDEDDEDNDGVNRSRGATANESLLMTRGSSASEDWTQRPDQSPEEGSTLRRFLAINAAGGSSKAALATQYVQLLKMKPSSEEEEREYMVRSFSSGTLFDVQPECMLCLEGFTETRPNALSLCGCGVNKNAFHLECLMEWRRKSNKTNCPICDNELFVDASLPGAVPLPLVSGSMMSRPAIAEESPTEVN